MWTLIKREIDDCRVFFVAGVAHAVFVILVLISSLSGGLNIGAGAGPLFLLVGMLLFCGMGAGQMYMDRTRGISCFLSTLSVTRGAIFTARVITGVLLILVTLVPMAAGGVIVLKVVLQPIPAYQTMFLDIARTVFLLSLACYSLGLLTGWAPGRVIPTLGGATLTFILMPIVIIKGFGVETAAILVLLTVAALLRSRQHFVSTSF
ncbi:MAG: hypothetical protein IH624_06485 [Phycisphaerae bacterium]|nr:hypothetical protein [Phycisphaerae bacterium]